MTAAKLLTASIPLSCALAAAAPRGTNYDESKVPNYTLPDPLVAEDGGAVTTPEAWHTSRRPEILELFRDRMYGRSPAVPAGMNWSVTSEDTKALNGRATRREIDIKLGPEEAAPALHLLLYLPNDAAKPVPAFAAVNFVGNHTICDDTGIQLHAEWTWDRKAKQERLVPAREEDRGQRGSRWQIPLILSRGYALATISRANVEPDYATGWTHGVRGYFLAKEGKTAFAKDDWGAIGAWAWSLSRVLDVLETIDEVDGQRVAVMGHSRLGKTALWAGARDERFALVISNNSGEGGAALARRCFGETTAVINRNFPHWFCSNFKQYADREDAIPFDQHQLLALSAPRPLYVASAKGDRWADPKGEFLSVVGADPVYRLLGTAGLGTDTMPEVNQPVSATTGYHIRSGKHDVTEFDWMQYLAFADRHLRTGRPR